MDFVEDCALPMSASAIGGLLELALETFLPQCASLPLRPESLAYS